MYVNCYVYVFECVLYCCYRLSTALHLTNIYMYIYLFISSHAKKRENRWCRLADSGTAGVPVYRSYDPN